ncbi:MAG: TonB-dependent receptor [Ideonella sp.]|nr:TonB-dependent receptor [Ideonella sp.]MCC7455451.1 TonB-dependent receptor [Nitrospira sp.]
MSNRFLSRRLPRRGLARRHAALAALAWAAAHAHAQSPPNRDNSRVAEASADGITVAQQRVTVEGHYDNAVGSSDAASQGTIRAELLKSRPPQRPGEVLEFVPGVIVTQHSGDGKANQYFLRGFNLDHGTDFATTVGGIPVNMPTHGHGQGYTDLNFLLPELVQRIEYRKGPYFANVGDFSAAGSADIVYRTTFDAPLALLTVGERGYRRGVLGGSLDLAAGRTLLGAFEAMGNDGPWTLKENLRRSNGVVTFAGGTPALGWSASAMAYDARWRATDQVPQRLIDAGTFGGRPFGRFDAIDTSDGGETGRSSVSGQWHRNVDGQLTRVAAYALHYRLKLFSNFTYFTDPVDGDQFSQQDNRHTYGLKASHAFGHRLGSLDARSELGVQLRHDRIHVGLFDTVARTVTAVTRDDRVRETLAGIYGQTSVEFSPRLRGVFGLRADQVRNRVESLVTPANSGRARDTLVSPKLSLVAGPFARTEVFFNAGRGFHSNDARGTTTTVDPKTGDPVDKVPPLVAAKGFEIGARTEVIRGLQSSLALWTLKSGSELVYVGDAGTTEASAGSRRRGIEFNNRWVPVPWFLLDADLAWTRARFDNGDRIPNAIDRVASLAATLRNLGPWSASLQLRHLGPGALVEDNSVRATASTLTNLRVSRQLGPNAELTLDVFNLFDRKVNDIQYFYESQLPGEAAPVPDRHVHPSEPRTARLSLRVAF